MFFTTNEYLGIKFPPKKILVICLVYLGGIIS